MSARFTIALALVLVMAAPADARASEDASFDLNGTWIGWAWLGEAGDLPLRLHLAANEEKIVAELDSPAHQLSKAPFEVALWDVPAIRLEGTSPGGSPVILDGKVAGNVIEGAIKWGKYEGSFELVRSPRPLAVIPLEDPSTAPGMYERAPGDVVELRARPWGELLYHELRTGRVRTLLPTGPDRFFIGSGIYLPHPIEGEIRLLRDGQGTVTAFEEKPTGGSTTVARRVHLEQEPVSFESGSVTLQGTLLRRADRDRSPAIVVVGGSSWETRDDVSFHARALASLGLAVLSYDKRGHGESGGDPVVPFATTAADTVAAVKTLSNRQDVRSDEIGVFGMSRGGWYAPLAASMSDDVAFLVLLVPPAVTPAAQETRSRLDQMGRDGFDRDAIELASRLLTATWSWLSSGEGWDDYASLRAEAVAAGVPDYVLESDSPDPKDWQWGGMNMFFDPCPTLAKLDIPILAIFGGDDIYVAERINRPKLRECVSTDARLTTQTIEGAGHSLAIPNDLPIHRQTGRGDEGYSIIADWIADLLSDS